MDDKTRLRMMEEYFGMWKDYEFDFDILWFRCRNTGVNIRMNYSGVSVNRCREAIRFNGYLAELRSANNALVHMQVLTFSCIKATMLTDSFNFMSTDVAYFPMN